MKKNGETWYLVGELIVGVGGEDPGPVPKVVQALCLQEDDGRSCPPSLRSPNRLPRPPNGLTNFTTSRSLVNEQPAHPAELAGKPPSEGTKVLVMELLKFRGLADVT